MPRRLVAIATLLALSVAARTEEKPRAAVAAVSLSAKLAAKEPEAGEKIARFLSEALAREYEVVATGEVDEALLGLSLTRKDLLNRAEDAARLGKALGVRCVLVARASLASNRVTLNVRRLDPAEGAYSTWSGGAAATLPDLPEEIPEILEEAGVLRSELLAGVDYYRSLPIKRRERLCRREYEEAAEDPARLKAAYEWFRARGEEEWAAKCVHAVAERAPEDDWANEKLGRFDLRKVYSRIPEDPLLDRYPVSALEDLLELQENAPRWGSKDEYRRAEKLLARVLEHLTRLREEPYYAVRLGIEREVSLHPTFGSYVFEVAVSPPAVVFAEHTGKESAEMAAAARDLAARTADRLARLHTEFHRHFGERLGLPPLTEQKSADLRAMRAMVFPDRAAFDRHYQALGAEAAPDGPCYDPRERWSFTWGDRPRDTFRAGTPQLLHIYRRIVLERESGEPVFWSDCPTATKSHWFAVGFPEFLAPVELSEDGGWDPGVPVAEHLAVWKAAAGDKKGDWPLADLLAVEDARDMAGRAALRTGAEDVARMSALFGAQSWAWCHFLWSYRRGKYRRALSDYLADELSGRTGIKHFEKAFWGEKKPRWDTVEKEWRRHAKSLW